MKSVLRDVPMFVVRLDCSTWSTPMFVEANSEDAVKEELERFYASMCRSWERPVEYSAAVYVIDNECDDSVDLEELLCL